MAGLWNASQDAQDAWNAGDASLGSGRNADGSDAGPVFADELGGGTQDQEKELLVGRSKSCGQ